MKQLFYVLIISFFTIFSGLNAFADENVRNSPDNSTDKLLICQDYDSINQMGDRIFNISGNWISNHQVETITLQVNQADNRFSWLLDYCEHGLTATGYGQVNGTVLNIMTNLPGRSVPSVGQIVNYDKNGNVTSIEFENILFYRQQ